MSEYGIRTYNAQGRVTFEGHTSHLTRFLWSIVIDGSRAGQATVNLGANKAAYPVVTPLGNHGGIMSLPSVSWSVSGNTGILEWTSAPQQTQYIGEGFKHFELRRAPNGYNITVVAFG